MASDHMKVLKTQWYHFTTIVIAGMGFLTDSYDPFCISMVTKLVGHLYYYKEGSSEPNSLSANVFAALTSVAFCVTLISQLFFGWLEDKFGKKRIYSLTLMLMVVCSIGSSLSLGFNHKAIMATLCFFRFWLGFGIGIDYPLSVPIMSEYSNKKTRGAFIAAVSGFGILAGGVFAIIVSLIFKAHFSTPSYQTNPISSTVPKFDYVWRFILTSGAVPAILTYYWRMKMPEPTQYTGLVANNTKQAASDMFEVLEVKIEAEADNKKISKNNLSGKNDDNKFGLLLKQSLRRHGIFLLGTTTTWFLDIAFYSRNLFLKDIFSAIDWLPDEKMMSAIEEVFVMARAQTLIAICSTMPGYWVTVALIDRIGRFSIQIIGFIFMTVFMFTLAIPYVYWTLKGNQIWFLVIIYSLTFFFCNFGPKATTFIMPVEIFPARMRSTCHGIPATAGIAGVILGSFGFLYASNAIGVRNALIILAVVNFLGLMFTFLLPKTKGRSVKKIPVKVRRRRRGH